MTNLFLKVNKDLFTLGLNPTEILLVAQVMEFQANKKECYMTDAQLAENFGVSAKTISRALDRLETLKLITRETKTIASKRIRTIIFNKNAFEASNGQNDVLEEEPKNLKQSNCPNETVNLSKSNGQNDFIKDKGKDKEKDNLIDESKVEEGSSQKPITVSKEWLVERHNHIQQCANGLFYYNEKFYKMEEQQ